MLANHLESQLQTLIEMNLDTLVITNAEGAILDMNGSLPNLTGINHEKLKDTNLADYFTSPKKAREFFQEIVIKNAVKNSPLTLQDKDGKLSDVLVNGSVYKDEKGNVLGIVVVVRENKSLHEHHAENELDQQKPKSISEELEIKSKKSEEQSATIIREHEVLSNFFTQAPAMLAILKGPEFVFEFANPPYIELIGNRDILGKTLLEALPEITGQGFIELLENVYNTGETYIGKEMPVKMDKGNGKLEQFYVNFTYQAFTNNKGKIEGIWVFVIDITELVTARKKQEANALMIHNIYMSAPAAICTFKGPTHIYELVNPAYENLFNKRDLVGKPFLEALPELKGQGVDKILDNIYNTGEVFTSTEIPVMLARAEHLEPEQRYFNSTMQPIYNEENKIIGVVNFSYDVTEQIMARKQIEASEKRFSNILSQSLMAIAILKGPQLIVAFANEPMLHVLGKGNAVLNKPLLEEVPELNDQVFPKLLSDVYTTGVPFEGFEIKCILIRNGIPVDTYFNFVYQPYRDVDDTITGITVICTEVTEKVLAKKENEEIAERVQLLADAQPQKVWTADDKGNRNYFNQQWFDYTQLTFEDLMDWGWKKIIHPKDWELTNKSWQHAIDTGESYECEHRLLRHDGSYRWHLTRAVAQKDKEGKVIMWVGSNTNIHEQKIFAEGLKIKVKEGTDSLEYIEEIVAKRTKQLADANSNLQKSNDELAQFAYIASHDMQEPLRKISSFTQMLEDRIGQDLDEQSKNYFNKINTSSTRMHTLIKDILSYSELVKKDKFFQSINLNQIVEGIKIDYDLLLEEKGASVKYENLPVIEAIPLQMSQLFGNLIGNSLKFAQKNIKPIITISAYQLTDEEKKTPAFDQSLDYVKIQLKDNGIGLNEEYTKQIFKIFQRLHNKSEYEGTGIGLAMCKKITLNHHGDINAEGSSEHGAVFNIFLPVRQINKLNQPELEH